MQRLWFSCSLTSLYGAMGKPDVTCLMVNCEGIVGKRSDIKQAGDKMNCPRLSTLCSRLSSHLDMWRGYAQYKVWCFGDNIHQALTAYRVLFYAMCLSPRILAHWVLAPSRVILVHTTAARLSASYSIACLQCPHGLYMSFGFTTSKATRSNERRE